LPIVGQPDRRDVERCLCAKADRISPRIDRFSPPGVGIRSCADVERDGKRVDYASTSDDRAPFILERG